MASKGAKAAGLALGALALVVGIVLGTRKKAEAAPPAQPEPGKANLYGKVTNSVTGQPVAGVSVNLEPGYQTQTDSNGDYQILDIVVRAYNLTLSKTGYQTINIPALAIVEGNNPFDVAIIPEGGQPPSGANFEYVLPIRQQSYQRQFPPIVLVAEVDVKNKGSVAGVCNVHGQLSCAEGDWSWGDFPGGYSGVPENVKQATIQPGQTVTFRDSVTDSAAYGYTCNIRFTGDPGTTEPVPMA
jgi:hypothetical protein